MVEFKIETFLLQSPLLSSHSQHKDKKGLLLQNWSCYGKGKKKPTRVRKQPSVSISHLQYRHDAEKPPKDISSRQDARSPGVTAVLVPPCATSPAASQTNCFAFSLTHPSDKNTYCGARAVAELVINTLPLLQIWLVKGKSVASNVKSPKNN